MYTARQLMTPCPLTMRATDTLDRAALYMELGDVQHLPVVEGTRLVGMLTDRELQGAAHQAQSRKPTVGQVMGQVAEQVSPEAPFREVIAKMTEQRLSAIAVTNDRGELLGIITRTDLRRVTVPLSGSKHNRAVVMLQRDDHPPSRVTRGVAGQARNALL
jgi:CBS domain-containing protein